MDPLTAIAASGLRARMESLDMLANNLANTETGGYKTDREFYNLYVAPEAAPQDGEDPATMPVIEKNWTDFSQGVLRPTSNPLDFALQGQGFFAVTTPSGTSYTRSGSFQVSSAGNLTTPEGYPVLDPKGKPIQIDPALPFTVVSDGTITQSGQTVGQLATVNFANPGDLVKQGNTLFRSTDPQVKPQPGTAEIHQGKLESSNVGSSESAVRLVSVMRHFEMLQKAINIGAEMNKSAIQEVARVNS